jgi:hypothetical protein
LHFFAEDLLAYVLATAAAVALLLLPGFGIHRLATAGRPSDDDSVAWSLVLGTICLPAIDALLIRFLGLGPAFLLHAILALVGFGAALRLARSIPLWAIGAILAFWLIVGGASIDVDWNGRLLQSLISIDTVKHAAVINAIAHDGLPLRDPFFARPGPSSYYYYFYLGPALIHGILGEMVNARAAFMAASFTTGFAFVAMLWLLARRARLIPQGAERRFLRLLVLLCALTGLDLLVGLFLGWTTGIVIPQLDRWEEELRWILTSILWVPHHLTAVIALFAGAIMIDTANAQRSKVPLLLASLAFATMFGASVWIALVAVPALLLWWLSGLRRPDAAPLWMFAASAALALIVVAPQVVDLVGGRSVDGSPFGLSIRAFGPPGPLIGFGDAALRLMLLPVGVGLEFGVFALGALLFATTGQARKSWDHSIGRLLILGAAVGLLASVFIRSTLINNDFGWRVIWLAQIPALLWTASIWAGGRVPPRLRRVFVGLVVVGLLGTAWDLAGLRFFHGALVNGRPFSFANQYPRVDLEQRAAYQWAAGHLPRDAIVQHNPVRFKRALDFGLYGHGRVAVADVDARLFGAPQTGVIERVRLIAPLFLRPIPQSEAVRRLQLAGVDYLMTTSLDPVWGAARNPPPGWTCVYRTPHVCIARVTAQKETG